MTAPADASAGPYTAIVFREWTVSNTGHGETIRDHYRVVAADRSGYDITRVYPGGVSSPNPDTPGTTTVTDNRDPGGFRDGITPPVHSEPPLLVAQIDEVQPWSKGNFAGLRALSETALDTYLTCPVRAGALQVFADTGAQYAGPTIDRAGRPGVAITIDTGDGAVRDTLIVDPHTGVILAYSWELLRNPGGYHDTFPRTGDYLLILISTHQTTLAIPGLPS